jgi:hypothetical protein
MARAQALREIEIEEPTVETSLKALRQNLNRLRREARKLDQTAVEECLSLAISLTSPRRHTD